MDFDDLRGKHALVTGGSSGIGRALAIELARRGAHVHVCGTDPGRIAETLAAAGAGTPHVVDVSQREQVAALATQVHASTPAVDVLVSCAGVGLNAHFLETTLDDWQWLLGINLFGTIHVLHAFVPKMVERKAGGHVINVGSGASFVGLPNVVAYSTSKFAVLGLGEALRTELRPHGIGVTTACPGFVKSRMTAAARSRGAAADPAYQQKMLAFFDKQAEDADATARTILKAAARDVGVAPVAGAAPLYYLKRFFPGIVPGLVKKLQERVLRAPSS